MLTTEEPAPGAAPAAVEGAKGWRVGREGASLAAATPHCSRCHGAAWNIFIYLFF